jgi:hypothetical protein
MVGPVKQPEKDLLSTRSGALAAFLNALISASMFAVAMLWIGPEAMSSPEHMAEAARDRRAALLTQDILKLASVAVSLVLIVVLARHIGLTTPSARTSIVGIGVLGEAALLGNAAFSLVALGGNATADILSLIGMTALGSLVIGGIWLILVNAIAWRHRCLPRVLCLIGLVAGTASLGVLVFPPVSLVSLVLGMAWSVWLGIVFWSHR